MPMRNQNEYLVPISISKSYYRYWGYSRSIFNPGIRLTTPPGDEQSIFDYDEYYKDEKDGVFDNEDGVVVTLEALPTSVAR